MCCCESWFEIGEWGGWEGEWGCSEIWRYWFGREGVLGEGRWWWWCNVGLGDVALRVSDGKVGI